MALDLAGQGLDVTVADARQSVLDAVTSRCTVRTVLADLADAAAVTQLAGPFDLVCGALASSLGFATLRAVILAGKSYCDISFMAEDALELDALAKERGVTAVVDCGVAPGLSNVLAGYAAKAMDPCEKIDIFVGGLPVERRWPYWYKVPYAPSDVFEIYTRPSRLVEDGEVVVKEALTEVEPIDFDGVGTLEAFNTDGLRSLVRTLPHVPNMREKTLRYPGHVELMRVFRETGLFSREPIEIGGVRVSPLDVMESLLIPRWKFEEGEADITVLRVVAEGTEGGRRVRRTWDLYDRYDPDTNLRSMSRTTAFPATIVAGMILGGRIRRPGVLAPEMLGQEPGMLDHVLRELERRGVRLRSAVSPIG